MYRTVVFLCFVLSPLHVTCCLWFYTEIFISWQGPALSVSMEEQGDRAHGACQPHRRTPDMNGNQTLLITQLTFCQNVSTANTPFAFCVFIIFSIKPFSYLIRHSKPCPHSWGEWRHLRHVGSVLSRRPGLQLEAACVFSTQKPKLDHSGRKKNNHHRY